VTIAVKSYVVRTAAVRAGATKPNKDNCVYPENLAAAQSQTAVRVLVMQFFEKTFARNHFVTTSMVMLN
jgi:hypothetical protein